ncbi:hypothetical protein BDF20DRAFT_262069 [Mycotypha africana]|uniref:uncharacterized protein n=1 Tax=Mycotypha africana TaxID=64632 RepID=UPI002301D5AB|nr:uncharacterized protein BDF20DRAFT_262069 [Mycotypha africana]KAI8987396.1 hypothetical protein BDF20DRAFT_262069 [Mycotypha africana]
MNLPRRTTNVDMMRNQNNVSDVNHINVNNRQRNSKNDYLAIEEVQNPATSLGSDLFMSLDDEQILEIIEKEEQIQQQPQQVKEIDNIHNDDESSSIETYTAKNLQVFESDDNMTENPKSNRKDSINDNILSFSSNNERSSGTGQQNSQTFQSQYETDDDIDLPSAPDFSMDDLPIFTNHPIQKNAIRQEKVKATVKGSKADENEDSAPYAFVVDEVDLNEIFSLSDENSQGKEPTYQQPGHPDALNKLEQENSLMENNAEFPEQTVSRMSPSLKNNSTITADNVDSDMHNIADNEIIAEVDPNNRKGEDSFTTELNLLSLSDDKPGEVASNALNTVDNNAFSTIAPAMLTPSTSTSTTSSSSSGNLKRISLRQRNEIQLRPYSYDYAKYKELISRTRLTPTKKKARRKQDGELGNDDDVADGSFGSISQLSVGLESDNDDELFASQYIPPEDNTNTATFEEEDISDEPDTLSFREEEESTTKYGLDTLIVPSALFKNRRKEKHKSHDRKGKGKEAMAHDLSNVERGSSMHRRQQITTAGFKRSGSFAVKKKKKNRITTTFTDKPSTKRWIGTAPEQPLTKDIFSFDLFNSSSTQSPTTGEVIPSSSFVSRGSQHKQSSHPNPSNLNDSTSLHTIEDSEEEKETFDTQLPLPTPRFRKRRYLELESSDEEDDETDKNDNNGNSTIWDYPAAGFGSDNDTNTINISDEEDDTFAVNSYQSQLSNPRLSTSVDYHHFKRLLSDSVSKTPKMNLKRRANEDDDFIEDDDFYNNSRDGRRKRPKKVTDKALRHVLPKSFYRLYKDDIEQESNQRRQNKNALSGRKQQLTISTTNTASSSTTDSSPKMRTGTAPKTYQSEIIGSQERNMENFAAFLGSQRDDESEEDEQLQDGANTRLDDVPDSYIDDNDLDMNYYGHPQTSAAAANRIERRRQTVLPPRTITLRINEYYHPDGQQPPRRQRAEQRSTLEKYLQQFEAERQQAITESVERDASFNRDLQRQETASTSRVTERIASTSDDGRLGISRGINGKDGNVNLRGSKNTILPVRTAVNTNVSSGIPTKKTISAGNSISQANHQHKKRKKPKRRTRDDIYIHKPQCVRYDRSGQAPAGVDYYNKRNLQQRPLPSTIPPIYPKKTSTDDIYLGTLHEHHNYNWKPLEMEYIYLYFPVYNDIIHIPRPPLRFLKSINLHIPVPFIYSTSR